MGESHHTTALRKEGTWRGCATERQVSQVCEQWRVGGAKERSSRAVEEEHSL